MSSRSIHFIRPRVSSASSVDLGEGRSEIAPTTTAARRPGTDNHGTPLACDLNSRISPIARLTTNVLYCVLWSIDSDELIRLAHRKLHAVVRGGASLWFHWAPATKSSE